MHFWIELSSWSLEKRAPDCETSQMIAGIQIQAWMNKWINSLWLNIGPVIEDWEAQMNDAEFYRIIAIEVQEIQASIARLS
jgi:hypothetical protein